MAGAATGDAASAPSVQAASSEISDLEVKGSVATSSGSAASRRRRLDIAEKMERMQNETRRVATEKEEVRIAEEERQLRNEMRQLEEEDIRQRLGEASSQSPTAAPLGHPPGLDAAMLFSIATPGSSPAGTPRRGSPGVVTSPAQQHQPARAVVRKELRVTRSGAPSTPRQRLPDMFCLKMV